MTTVDFIRTLVIAVSIVYISLGYSFGQNHDLIAPPLLANSTEAPIIVPPTLPSWMRSAGSGGSQNSATAKAAVIIQPPTLRPHRTSTTSPRDIFLGNKLVTTDASKLPIPDQTGTLHADLPAAPPLTNGQIVASKNSSDPQILLQLTTDQPLPAQAAQNALHSILSSRVHIDESVVNDTEDKDNHGVVVSSVNANVHLTKDLSTTIGPSNGNNGLHVGSDLSPESGNTETEDTGLVCYGSRPAMVARDVPCPTDSTRRAAVTDQLLEVFLQEQGGGIVSSIMSATPPQHLTGLDLSNIEASDWMNYNRSDLYVRLLDAIAQVEANQLQLHQRLTKYLACECLQNINSLTNLFLEVVNATSHFNTCFTDRTDDSDCTLLLTYTENLDIINHDARQLLAALSSAAEKLRVLNVTPFANGFPDNNTDDSVSDLVIDELVQRLSRVTADFKIYETLQQNLFSAITDFKDAVVNVHGNFFHALQINKTEHNFTTDMKQVILNAMDSGSHPAGNAGFGTSHSLRAIIDGTLGQALAAGGNPLMMAVANQVKETNSQQGTADDASDLPGTETPLASNGTTGKSPGLYDAGDYEMNEQEFLQAITVEILDALVSELSNLTEMLSVAATPALEDDEALANMTSWHQVRSRTRRDTAGYVIASDACQRQGNVINDTEYLSLCTSCMHTTVLDDTFYPRYLTEKICGNGTSSDPVYSNGCLFQPGQYAGGAGGLCQQQEFHIILLQQVPGRCMKVTNRGQEMITDKWESITHSLRIGCECVVNQNSQFAKYAVFP